MVDVFWCEVVVQFQTLTWGIPLILTGWRRRIIWGYWRGWWMTQNMDYANQAKASQQQQGAAPRLGANAGNQSIWQFFDWEGNGGQRFRNLQIGGS
jgi:hypothetical protein